MLKDLLSYSLIEQLSLSFSQSYIIATTSKTPSSRRRNRFIICCDARIYMLRVSCFVSQWTDVKMGGTQINTVHLGTSLNTYIMMLYVHSFGGSNVFEDVAPDAYVHRLPLLEELE
jgi:hypothetical protein